MHHFDRGYNFNADPVPCRDGENKKTRYEDFEGLSEAMERKLNFGIFINGESECHDLGTKFKEAAKDNKFTNGVKNPTSIIGDCLKKLKKIEKKEKKEKQKRDGDINNPDNYH